MKTVFRSLLFVAICVAGYLLTGEALYLWKEHTHHYVSGARSELLALHTMQENYRSDHGCYAQSFSELGVPQGARLEGDVLIWDGPYEFHFERVLRDSEGAVVHYIVEAKPRSTRRKLPTIEIDDAGKVEP